MSASLKEKQIVPLTCEERAALRDLTQESGLTIGLLARVLLVWAMDNIGDDALADLIRDERAEAKTRASRGARAAIAKRWGGA